MKVVKNYLINLTYQILTIILPIITIPYVSRVLGADGLGRYALTNTYAQYFVLLGMIGLSTYSSREIAYVRDDNKKLSETFWEINFLRFMTMGLSIIVYILLIRVVVAYENRMLYLIQSLIIFAALFDISWLFIGLENFKKVVIRNTIVKVVGIILIFGLVRSSSQVWLYALILGATQLIGQVIMFFEIPHNIYFTFPKKVDLLRHLRCSIRLFIPQVSINVYTMLDKVMLGALTNEAQVGMYDNSQKVIKILVTVVTTLAVVTVPKMSNLYRNKKYDELKDNAYKSFSFVSFISFPMTFGLMGVCKSFVPWFYGEGFEGIVYMFYIGSFLMITLGWSSILGSQILISIKREKEFTVAVTTGAIINVILNFILISKYGGVGTTISSVIAEYSGMFLMAYFLRDILNIGRLFKSTVKYLISSLIMFIVIWIICLNVKTTILNSFILIAVGAVFYLIIMILIKDENLLYAVDFLKKSKRFRK